MARQDDEFLTGLLNTSQPTAPAIVPTSTIAPAIEQQTRRRSRPAPSGAYETAVGKLALLIALGLVGALWWVGARFTLLALENWGLTTAGWGLAAWLIPLAITMLETGVMLTRAKEVPVWLLWAVVLGVDVFATAIGIMAQWPAAFPAAAPNTWVIVGGVGLALALAPEWAGRSIVRELLK